MMTFLMMSRSQQHAKMAIVIFTAFLCCTSLALAKQVRRQTAHVVGHQLRSFTQYLNQTEIMKVTAAKGAHHRSMAAKFERRYGYPDDENLKLSKEAMDKVKEMSKDLDEDDHSTKRFTYKNYDASLDVTVKGAYMKFSHTPRDLEEIFNLKNDVVVLSLEGFKKLTANGKTYKEENRLTILLFDGKEQEKARAKIDPHSTRYIFMSPAYQEELKNFESIKITFKTKMIDVDGSGGGLTSSMFFRIAVMLSLYYYAYKQFRIILSHFVDMDE